MHKYIVASSEPNSPSTQLITLKKVDNQRPFAFEPGQYAAISFFRKGRPTPARCFSLASSPTDQDHLQFSMRTKGKFTSAAKMLSAGDNVNVRGPFGGFVFDSEEHQDIVLLAGGIGITPFISMIRYATRLNLSNKITLIYSSRNQDDVAYAKELKQLASKNPYLRIIYIIADGEADKFANESVIKGRMSSSMLGRIAPDITAKTFFICGPPGFMKAMDKILKQHGVSSADILTEAFSQGPNSQTGKIRSWPFNIYLMGPLSFGLATFIIMAADLIKTLPPGEILKQIQAVESEVSHRESDIDDQINKLPDSTSTEPASTAANNASTSQTNQSGTTNPNTTTPSSTNTTTNNAPSAPRCVSTPSMPC